MHRAISCLLFDDEQVRSLTSILSLLKGYLADDWSADTAIGKDSALVLVNLDHAEAPALMAALDHGLNVAGCANRPRQFETGTLHRPFRGHEILARLKEVERHAGAEAGGGSDEQAVQALQADDSRIFKLYLWPEQFTGWSRQWWRILAALRRQSLTIEQIVAQTGVERAEVARCLDTLLGLNAVSVKFDLAHMQVAPPRAERRGLWSRLGARVGELLRRR
ncbi:hypothetical protein [Xanthomonas massiliensis]|uniref:hypothetical protein n=1 Tax=Xanthomonas massiliensis TaxID=1720302 RepID=UPI000827109F|nr:hypothetical protein [Xanthomonas massiliensis]